MDWAAAMDVAKNQRGVITRDQLVTAGFSRSTLTRAVADGRLIRMLESVYRIPTAPLSWESRAVVALLRAGPDAALSHASAGVFWRLPDFPPVVEQTLHVSVPNHRRPILPAGYEVHRPRRPFIPFARDGLRVTRLARTIVDLAAELSDERLEICLDDAHRRFRKFEHWITLELNGLDARRHPGVGTLRSLLALRKGIATESPLETRLRRAVRERGIPEPTWQLELFDAAGLIMRVDAAYPEHLVAVHGDSYQWHSSRHAFDSDAAQRRRIAALGWVSIAVTNTDLECETWVDELVRLLDQRKPQHDFFIPRFIPRSGAPRGSSRPAR